MALLFQTKIDPEYLRQIQSRTMQEQWLEAQLEDLGLRIARYNNTRAADQSNYMAITTAAIECIFLLKTTLLEPVSYEKLYRRVCEFVAGFRQYFADITANPVNRLLSPYQLYVFVQRTTVVIPRLYLMALAASVWLEHLGTARKMLHEDPEGAPAELAKMDMPTTADEIRQLRRDILTDIHEFCRSIQNPLRHLFLRDFIVSTLRPYLDFDLAEPGVVVADIDVTLSFLLKNYVEMNRFWVRTQYEPARTRKESDRRDKRRLYLSDMISQGFREVSKLCAVEGLESDVLVEVLRQIKLSGDPISTATILEGVCAHIQITRLFDALDDIFPAIVSGCQGVKSFIILLDRISANKDKVDVTEELYARFCEAGLGLCHAVLHDISVEGIDQVDKITGMTMDSAWISCINALLVFSSRVWPENLQKLTAALQVLMGIIFPGCSEAHINSYVESVEGHRVPQVQPVQLLDRDDDSLVKTLTAPLIRLKADLMPHFLYLAPCRALRCYLSQKSERLVRDFSLGVAYALLENPLTVSPAEYARDPEAAGKLGKFCLNNVYTLARTDPLLFGKCIQSFHAAAECYAMLMDPQYNVSEEAKAEIYPSLFYVCHRDGLLREAGKVAKLVDDLDQTVAIKLHIDNAKSLILALDGTVFTRETFTKDDLFDELAAAILVYECHPDSRSQGQILCEMMSIFGSIKLPDGEEEAIIGRLVALANALLIRKDRAVALAKCAQVYKAQNLEERATRVAEMARVANSKWHDDESTQKMNIYLQGL
ncbi:Vacuolar protein sorting 35 [Giardia muris]|uniref:Vacuolar protein sorting 35 n=1 Tax=Giardia muris TaxID=5742 RepID=A0A4Z1T3Q1_GIAMU|nr:Vacuolar protein sorting 35 [Giardia muris]|eukprot:TNJ27677.1 Vacuolar protein sorting 35 [Giardia muris]